MVLQKRLEYGFNGYQVPAMPRATRSARRSSFRKKAAENEQCRAFDLLATVAGELLLEGGSLSAAGKESSENDCCDIFERSASKEPKDQVNIMKIKHCDQRSCYSSKEFPCTLDNAVCPSEKIGFDVDEPNKNVKVESLNTEKALVRGSADPCSAEDSVVFNGMSPAAVSLDNSGSLPMYWENVKLGISDIRDDDENSSRCTQPSTTAKTFRQPSQIVDQRIRKFLASKYWKLHSRNGNISNEGKSKPIYGNWKACFRRPRSRRIYPFRRRKMYACSSASCSDGGYSCEGISSSSKEGILCDAAGSHASAFREDQQPSCQSMDSHVKLRIESFKVPELFIDIPPSATIGSLKRTVMEAVATVFGVELHVGVLLQGKSVRDDDKTLLQTGIFHDNIPEALGFTLEPNPSQAPPASGPTPCDPPQPLKRHSTTSMVHKGPSDLSLDPSAADPGGNPIERDHDSVPSSSIYMPRDKGTADSLALVSIPAESSEALAIVPMHWVSKRSQNGKRRIRRPFSVSEVEALVQAVEKLGTGRWRDVKLRAFDDVKHRTYVDLKDKWKTLVHTARISPQQRRGEPVPQELLDRVLQAHAHWTNRHHSPAPTKLHHLHHQFELHQLPPPERCLLV